MNLFDRQCWAALLACLLVGSALAHEGHDHGADPQPAAGTVAPRFEARSDLFELVGVLQGDELLLYLDRAADNAPVREGEIEIESASVQGKATADAGGVFRLKAGGLAQPGKHALTLTVTAGEDVDLLTATFEHGATESPVVAVRQGGATTAIAGGLVLLLVLAWFIRTRKSA